MSDRQGEPHQRHGWPCVLHKLHDLVVDQALRLRLLKLHVVVAHIGLCAGVGKRDCQACPLLSQQLAPGAMTPLWKREHTFDPCNAQQTRLVLKTRVVLLPDDRLRIQLWQKS